MERVVKTPKTAYSALESKLLGHSRKAHSELSLEKDGVFFLPLSEAVRSEVEAVARGNFAKTFNLQEVPTSLEEMKRLVAENKVEAWGKGNGMYNRLPLDTHLKHPLTNTIHTRNWMAAQNKEVWKIILKHHPELSLKTLFGGHFLIPCDGLKNKRRDETGFRKLTGIHFDAQQGALGRLQAVLLFDTGPNRLCVVPGTHLEEVHNLIKEVTHDDSLYEKASNFTRLTEDKRLFKLFHENGLSLSGPGLVVFRPTVIHFESIQFDATAGRSVFTEERVKMASDTFRIYCGAVLFDHRDKHLFEQAIVFAYLREHGWALEPFTTKQPTPFFVNHKKPITPKRSAVREEERQEFYALCNVSIEEMKIYLEAHCSQLDLILYGILL